MNEDLTTLICLFHHQDQAQAALEDILKAGIPQANVTVIGPGSTIDANRASLTAVNVPERDIDRLLDGVKDGGAVLTVSSISDMVEKVESIFKNHRAGKIDEADVDDDMSAAALPASSKPYDTLPAAYADTPSGVTGVAVPALVVDEIYAGGPDLADDEVLVVEHTIPIVPLDESNADLSTPDYGTRTEVH